MSETVFPRLLTVNEVALMLRVSSRTVRAWVDKGAISAVKIESVIRIPITSLPSVASDGKHGMN